MKNKKVDMFKMKLAVVVALTIFISGTVTYGYFNSTRSQSGTNDLVSDCFDISFTNETASISLANAYPIEDSKGQEGTPYSFTITNTCDTEATYHVLLSSKGGSFDNRFVKTSINEETPKKLSGYMRNVDYKIDEGYDRSYILKTGSLRKDESASFAIRLWIDSATTYEDVQGKSWEGQVRVVSTVTAIEKEPVYLLSEELIEKANDASIAEYANGNTAEMYTFSHEATEQTPALTDYRYIGSSPNNYITFNDETWRIIGVFPVKNVTTGAYENHVKLVRKSITMSYWNSNNNDSYGINEWVGGEAEKILNEFYLNQSTSSEKICYEFEFGIKAIKICDFTSTGLKEESANMISNTVWYLGGTEDVINGEMQYLAERSLNTCSTNGNCSEETRSTYIQQKVGLLYPSDYIYTYSLGVDKTCFENNHSCDDRLTLKSWLHRDIIKAGAWTLTPSTKSSQGIFYINGYSGRTITMNSKNTDDITPVVYLNDNINLVAGDGSQENPYIIK